MGRGVELIAAAGLLVGVGACSSSSSSDQATPVRRYVAVVEQPQPHLVTFSNWSRGECGPDEPGCGLIDDRAGGEDATDAALRVEAEAVQRVRAGLAELDPPSARAARTLRLIRPTLDAYDRAWQAYDACSPATSRRCHSLRVEAIDRAQDILPALQRWRREVGIDD